MSSTILATLRPLARRSSPSLSSALRSSAPTRASSSGSSTPYRFRFLLHTEEFQEQLNKRTTDEALRERVLEELKTLNQNKNVTPTLTTSLSDLKLNSQELQVLRYDLADAFGFYIPSGEPIRFTTGEDVVEWIRTHTAVLKRKAAGTERFQPRNMTGGF
ncbi:hypothetical protein M427DRAFT_63006 [Gonapodya prolifera JEL478]|uniref:Uncharacterized protein n=1 Tax=Gonapodya prolifera (strain JEL478) TaxID=1344416 RepID=A0A138ZZZ1_GONPJ|nr:hypothetical protein M427DRAFT_63006 [Gonapodya prolifera JEL478]|eukprot:KXS10069.1 hypothetical protein M427DRAFT_63006 [Gonapodya prolifera JEL478]